MRKISSQEAEDFMILQAELAGGVSPFPWSLPQSTLKLSSNDVHIWIAELNSLTMHVHQFAQYLNDEKRMRANRFHLKQDREQFSVCRGVLRIILGQYLRIEPNRIQFSYGPHGKPYLEETVGDSTLRFNLGHSNDIALYAFTRCREIGVDIEYLRALPDADQVANRFFSADENAALHALPASQRRQAFFNCWTRKEAYIKAIGKGLAQPLDQFEVSLAPTDPVNLLHVEGAPKEASRWSLNALTPAPGYVAALAVEGHNWRPTIWQFPESTSEVYQSSQTSRIQ
jgi:4'-phosphopantetheinyl transferase